MVPGEDPSGYSQGDWEDPNEDANKPGLGRTYKIYRLVTRLRYCKMFAATVKKLLRGFNDSTLNCWSMT